MPKLRSDLDVMPSPVPEYPGLFLRDPFQYTSAMLVVPPLLIPALAFLDGERSDLELQSFLTRRAGQLVTSDLVGNFVETLRSQGFLETEEYYRLRDARHAAFRDAPERTAAHAGSGYPNHPEQLRKTLTGYLHSAAPPASRPGMLGLAAPHVTPSGGWKSYAHAYAGVAPALAEKTFVVLGTSHYGRPENFGLTRKPFATPLGKVDVDVPLVDWITRRAGESVTQEDYCHAIEHSIEFQCIFLQQGVGPEVRILPILCGPFLESFLTGAPPESNDATNRFFDVLGELAEREGSRLFWVLGVDLAHIGRRYGDSFAARAGEGPLASVREQDRTRLDSVCAGDQAGFFELVSRDRDELRWCGYSALYTFLKAVPAARGNLLHYEQWNIDAESVVSFAALEFFRDGVAKGATEPQRHRDQEAEGRDEESEGRSQKPE